VSTYSALRLSFTGDLRGHWLERDGYDYARDLKDVAGHLVPMIIVLLEDFRFGGKGRGLGGDVVPLSTE
jgi:hypothetical protein